MASLSLSAAICSVMLSGGGAPAAPFDPAVSLFGAGEQGVIFDVSDATTLFKDSGGTIPATTLGDTVVRQNDISGRGNHIIYSGGVLLAEDGAGKRKLTFNGGSTEGVTATINMSGTSKVTVWAGLSNAGGSSGSTLVKFGIIGSQAGSFDLGPFSSGLLLYRRGSTGFGGRATATIGTAARVASFSLDFTGATQATENPALRVDGVQGALTEYGSGDSGAGPLGTYVLTVGNGQARFNGGMYCLIVRGAASTQAELENGELWVAQRVGVTLPFTAPALPPAPSYIADGGTEVARTGYTETAPFSRLTYTTDATSFTLNAYSSTYSVYPSFAEVGVIVNGVWNQTVAMTAQGANAIAVTLPAGTGKTVQLVNGLQARGNFNLPQDGTWVTGVSGANATMTPVLPSAPANRILFYGDSITTGGNATPATRDSYAMRVRAAYAPNSVAVEAYGSRSLKSDCADSSARAAFVAKVVAYAPAKMWLAIGTNDYGLNNWAPADFETAYGALLDALHTALPSMAIYAQTPLTRGGAANTNVFGATLSQYRTAVSNAATARSGWVTLVDGTTLCTEADLADGVHPSTAGHGVVATAVKAVLGI